MVRYLLYTIKYGSANFYRNEFKNGNKNNYPDSFGPREYYDFPKYTFEYIDKIDPEKKLTIFDSKQESLMFHSPPDNSVTVAMFCTAGTSYEHFNEDGTIVGGGIRLGPVYYALPFIRNGIMNQGSGLGFTFDHIIEITEFIDNYEIELFKKFVKFVKIICNKYNICDDIEQFILELY